MSVTDTGKGKAMTENSNTNKVDFFTREGSLAATVEDIPAIAKAMRSKVNGNLRAAENLVLAAAYATHAAIRVATVAGEDFNMSSWAKECGDVARVTAYIWKRMAVAHMDLGVERGSVEWTALVGKAAASKSPVSTVLDGYGFDGFGAEPSDGWKFDKNGKKKKGDVIAPTREALDEALSYLFERDENGVLIPSKPRKAEDIKKDIAALKGETVEDETGEGASDANAVEQPTLSLFEACLGSAKYLADHIDQLSTEEFKSIAPLLRQANVGAKVHADAIKAEAAAVKAAS